MNQKRRLLFLCLSSLIFSAISEADEASCLNPQGHPVAWWVLVKVPDSTDDYVYRDANSPDCAQGSSCWGDIRHDLNDLENGPLSRTLQQIYRGSSSDYLVYNDDTSGVGNSETHSDFAHAKGFLASRGNSGFWLVHSVPRFPHEEIGKEPYNGLTSNARMNAQSFLCLSLSNDQVDVAASQLQLARPFVYQKSGFNAFSDAETPESEQQSKRQTLVTTDGTNFTSLTKSRYWGHDFYDDLVSPELDANLFVESWNRGRGTLRNACATRRKVSNITEVQIGDSVAWENRKDHSKWAVTTDDSASHAVCIGDINRQSGQRVRGGGTVCVANESLWKAFYGMIKGAGRCSKAH